MPFNTETISQQALQQALGNMFKVGEDNGNGYQVSYGFRNNPWNPMSSIPGMANVPGRPVNAPVQSAPGFENHLWKPIANVPGQYSYDSPGQASAGTGLESLVRVLKEQHASMQRTTPNYYEYRSQQPGKMPYFENLYGVNNQQGAQLSGGQKMYQPVWEQAGWMKPQDRQSFLQEKAQAPQQVLGSNPGNNSYGNELSNLNMLTSVADSRNNALTESINRAVSNDLTRKGNENHMASIYWGQR